MGIGSSLFASFVVRIHSVAGRGKGVVVGQNDEVVYPLFSCRLEIWKDTSDQVFGSGHGNTHERKAAAGKRGESLPGWRVTIPENFRCVLSSVELGSPIHFHTRLAASPVARSPLLQGISLARRQHTASGRAESQQGKLSKALGPL